MNSPHETIHFCLAIHPTKAIQKLSAESYPKTGNKKDGTKKTKKDLLRACYFSHSSIL